MYIYVTAVMSEAIKYTDLIHNLLFHQCHTLKLPSLHCSHTKHYKNDWHRHRNSNPFTYTHTSTASPFIASVSKETQTSSVSEFRQNVEEVEETERGMEAKRGGERGDTTEEGRRQRGREAKRQRGKGGEKQQIEVRKWDSVQIHNEKGAKERWMLEEEDG